MQKCGFLARGVPAAFGLRQCLARLSGRPVCKCHLRSPGGGWPLLASTGRLDIDRFKSTNDRLGRAAGDWVLKEFAAKLKTAVRITYLAVRLTGNEFVVLPEGVQSETEAALVAEKIVTAMHDPFLLDGASLIVMTSVGVAYCERPECVNALMVKADEALYETKGAGRNCFQLRTLNPSIDPQPSGPAAAMLSRP